MEVRWKYQPSRAQRRQELHRVNPKGQIEERDDNEKRYVTWKRKLGFSFPKCSFN